MENFIISFNAVAPIFILLALGYFLTRVKVLTELTTKKMNNLCFKVFFPVLLFNSIYNTKIEGAFSPKLLLTAVITVSSVFVLLFILIPIIEKNNAKRGVLIQAIFRSNFVIFGLPITTAICGSENLGSVSILIAVIVPLYNALSIIALEVFRGEKIRIGKILKGIATNPFIIGGTAGIIFLLLKIPLPAPISSCVSDLSKIATPLALILLGATFKFSDIRPNIKGILIGSIGKLFVIPLICIPLFIILGFRGTELTALTVMIGAPTAVSSFTMAEQMNADKTLAGQIVVFDSIGAVFTMFLWLFILMQLSFI